MPVVLEPNWVGRRVTLRRVLERTPDGRLLHGDVVGELLGLDAQTAVVDTSHGLVEVPVALVTAARLAPPSTADELALEAIAARGWRAEHTEQLGGWLLRASGGFTGRANSVLPLKAPGMALEAALERARDWYAGYGLPLRFQVPTESRRLLDADLGERGWAPSPDVHVLTARLDAVTRSASVREVELQPGPDAAWLRVYRNGQGATPAGLGVLTRHDRVIFACIRSDDGTALAVGRGTVDDDWLGVTCVEVVPEHRRTGLAVAVMQALWAWGTSNGAVRSHLEVSADNTAALSLYDRLGYFVHHDYRYRTDPDAQTSADTRDVAPFDSTC